MSLYALPPKGFFPSDPATISVHSLSSGASDSVHGHMKGMSMDGFRVSLSSAISSSSHGSGHDDGDALGDVFIWGEGIGEGVLGGGSHRVGSSFEIKMDSLVPKALESSIVLDVQNIACGGQHAVLVTKQGETFSWGEESEGRLGHGVDSNVQHPKLIDALGTTNIELVACGEYHSCAVSLSGDLYTWGKGDFGILGHGNEVSHWIPKRVNFLMEGIHVSSIACGPYHTAVVTSAGQLFTFGDGTFGVLGHGDKKSVFIPREVDSLKGLRTVRAACGVWHTAAVVEVMVGSSSSSNCSSGKLFTWGDGDKGRLGHVLTAKTEVYTWGKGSNGRLGHGDVDDRNSPTLVESLRDKQVKSIACGSNFTAVVCLHKWASGMDQSMCSGCRQPFNLRRKRHNCYNCGLVFCHSCSSKKSLKACMAPNQNKPFRVCDKCFNKLKKAMETDGSSHSSLSRRESVNQGSDAIDRDEKLESRSDGQLTRFSLLEPVRQVDNRSKKNKKYEFNSSRVSPVPGSHRGSLNITKSFNPTFGVSKKFFSASVPGSRIASRATSPISRRPSPPRSTTPTPTLSGLVTPRIVVDDTKRTNDNVSQEVLMLRSQVENLTRKAQLQEVELERTTKQLKEALAIASEETARCKAAKDVIKSLTAQLKDMAERLPVGSARTIKSPSHNSFGSSPDYVAPSSNSLNRPNSRGSDPDGPNTIPMFANGASTPVFDGASFRQQANHAAESINRISTRAKESEARNENEWVEQDEPGVYITLTALPGGARDLKRVRFSRKRFSEKQAEEWWAENRGRVYEQYNVRLVVDKSSVGVGSDDLAH
ncbi:hypothetical protein HID58_050935 [Brassica napus]|uniref:Uncharacterized protein n=1 Tax=Brassica napus TaxID=3708 RepID=A0ABQ8A7L7_BRANA|nr:hypothetical protein HID58_050935 [Brassica napus]